MTTEKPPECGAPTNSGRPCRMRGNLSPTNGLCLAHDPERVDEWKAFTRKGQANAVEKRRENRRREAIKLAEEGGPPPPVGDSLEDLVAFHRHCMDRFAKGRMGEGELKAITNAVRVQQAALSKRDLEREIRELREVAKQFKQLKRRMAAGGDA